MVEPGGLDRVGWAVCAQPPSFCAVNITGEVVYVNGLAPGCYSMGGRFSGLWRQGAVLSHTGLIGELKAAVAVRYRWPFGEGVEVWK